MVATFLSYNLNPDKQKKKKIQLQVRKMSVISLWEKTVTLLPWI